MCVKLRPPHSDTTKDEKEVEWRRARRKSTVAHATVEKRTGKAATPRLHDGD